jgi:hypothetical protein
MDVAINPVIQDMFDGRITTHSFYQDVGRIRRRISADIERGVFVSVEASWCDMQDEEWGAMICAVTYTAEGQFAFAFKYYEDGTAVRIGEREGVELLSALFDSSWCAEPRPDARREL